MAMGLQGAFIRLKQVGGSAPEATFPMSRAGGPGDPVRTLPARASSPFFALFASHASGILGIQPYAGAVLARATVGAKETKQDRF